MPAAVPPVDAGAVGAPPVVPGYTLDTLLGRGGSGEVWRAVPRRGGEPVAVKVLVAGDPERQAREAALLGALDHPHLVRLIEVVHQPRRGGAARVALVLDLLPGGSLAALLSRRGRLRPGEVVTTIAPVAAALAHAHGNGVVHGDLSPGNIVFTADGRPVLTDLGVARVLGEEAAAEVTPPYVDPTVARGGAPGPASDVFGIAAAAFHALTGIAPWNAATPADTLAVAAGGLLPDLAELAPAAPPQLLAVISRGLAADPHDRGSAAAFALDLRHACRPEPVRLPRDGVPDADLGRTGRGPRTELTHQVPGHRARPAPVVVGPPARGRGRWSGRWARPLPARAGLLGVTVLAVVAVLLGAGWLGMHEARDGGPPGDGARAVEAAVGSAVDGPGTVGPASGEPAPDTPVAGDGAPSAGGGVPGAEVPPAGGDARPADRPGTPGPAEAWQAVVADLYQRRVAAFTATAPEAWGDVYTSGSSLRSADEEHARRLAAADEALRGFAPEVVAVTAVRTDGDRVELELLDRWPGYDVVAGGPDGPALRTVPGRPETTVRMVLARTVGGWRIESARRLP